MLLRCKNEVSAKKERIKEITDKKKSISTETKKKVRKKCEVENK